jgi:SecD/SecF fusion protein
VSKYQKLFVLVIALAIAAGVICAMIPISPGLDIAGGLRVVLQIDPKQKSDWPTKPEDRAAKMKTVADTMRQRVKGVAGVTEPIVRVENPTSDNARLVVELPGAQNKAEALRQLTTSASLEFYYLKDVSTPQNPLGMWRMEIAPGDEKSYIFTGPKGETLNSGKEPDQPKIISEVAGAPAVKPILTGSSLLANAKSSFKTSSNEPIIEIEFNTDGTQLFRDFTGAHVGEILAIFYDGKLLTAPTIKDKISDGKAEVSGFSSLREATRIATFLNAGALPVPLKVIGKDVVEPSLGKQAITKVLFAGVAGLVLVLLFMMLYYKLPGVLASAALGLYALFTIAVFKVFHVTLSLAGMAALIISIGMAVDANILIFERLKEELRSGKTLRAAIDAGFNRAFTAIFDSNMCTAITCAVLMWLGSPTVQSFAFTLLIGVAISMFTAITVTRTFLHLLVNWEWAQNPALYGLTTGWMSKPGLSLDIVGKRNFFFAFSAILIIPGVIVLGMFHLRPGIEFTSGTTFQASFNQAVPLNTVRDAVDAISPGSEVQLVERGKTAFITTRLLSENGEIYDKKMEALRVSLNDKFGLTTKDDKGEPTFDSVTSVGPTISQELTTKAFWAVVFASVLIVLYLTIRFAIGGLLTGLKYGTCAVIALIHDASFILGGFAIMGHFFGWETDSLFVTAVLTIIGFSVHDTIVVFDRIRENLRHRQRGESFEQLANRSIMQTLSRSINTSFTVVLTLATLVAFGGPLLRHFYLTLMVGIIIGTYSSIFNATPLVIVWDKLGERGRTPRRRTVEERALVEKPLVSGIEQATSVQQTDADSAGEKPIDAARTARPKRKKKRF